MPKKIIEKERISLSLNKEIVHALKKKARGNANTISEQAQQILQSVLFNDKTYLEYEHERLLQNIDVIEFKMKKHNRKIDRRKK